MARDRNSVQSGQQFVEPFGPAGAKILGQPLAVQVDHSQRPDRHPELLREAHPDQLVWHHHQLSTGRELQATALLCLARQTDVYILVKITAVSTYEVVPRTRHGPAKTSPQN